MFFSDPDFCERFERSYDQAEGWGGVGQEDIK